MPTETATTTPQLRPRAERKAAGKALRNVVSRESHAAFTIDRNRDPLPILTAGDAGRLPPLLPERYRRMSASAFAFYRGTAALMAHDLAASPRIGLPVQACGDCHLMNFGAFTSPEGNVLFDINDFDETHPGVDFVVDLKRLAASVAIAAQDAKMGDKRAKALAKATAAAYRAFMHELAEKPPLEAWQTRMDLQDQLDGLDDASLQTRILGKLAKAEKRAKTPGRKPASVAGDGDGLRFVDESGAVDHADPEGRLVRDVLDQAVVAMYRASLQPERAALLDRYAVRDMAFKIVGVGAVGTYCAVALLATADDDQIVLQFKEAKASVIAGLGRAGDADQSHGKRVVDGQRALQAASDIFLGWTHVEGGRQFYVRQLKNRRLGSIGEVIEGHALPAYATLCGRTLARAHARTADPAMIAGYLGNADEMDEALATFSMAYAGQTAFDYAKLTASDLVPPTQVRKAA